VDRLERVEAGESDVVLLDESADVDDGVLVDDDAAASFRFCDAKRLLIARANVEVALSLLTLLATSWSPSS
jgi:hypothetical protein